MTDRCRHKDFEWRYTDERGVSVRLVYWCPDCGALGKKDLIGDRPRIRWRRPKGAK